MKIESKIKAVKEEKSYGHLRLSSKDFPDVKNLKIGESKDVTVTVSIRGLRAPDRWEISEGQGKPGDIFADVNITNVKLKTKKS